MPQKDIMTLDIGPMRIIPLVFPRGENTVRTAAHALHTSRTRPFYLALGLFPMAHFTSLITPVSS
jgi:hypothetical protein